MQRSLKQSDFGSEYSKQRVNTTCLRKGFGRQVAGTVFNSSLITYNSELVSTPPPPHKTTANPCRIRDTGGAKPLQDKLRPAELEETALSELREHLFSPQGAQGNFNTNITNNNKFHELLVVSPSGINCAKLKPKIVIVDDDPMLGQMLTEFLGGRDYRVISFTRAKDALDYLANNTIGFLLTDMEMPEMSGLELLRQVKTLYPTLPAMVMSGLPAATLAGSAGGNALDEIFSLGADFIPKPFDMVDLLIRIDLSAKGGCKRQ